MSTLHQTGGPTPKSITKFREWLFLKAAKAGSRRLVGHLLPKVKYNPVCLVSALHLAVDNNRLNVVEKLLESGVPVNTFNESGYNALHLAAIGGDQFMVETLLNYGANVNDSTHTRGDTALHLAAGSKRYITLSFSQALVAEKLLARGADINRQNTVGDTALHNAICCRNKDGLKVTNTSVAMALIDKNPDLRIRNINNYTPLDWARFNDVDHLVIALEKAEAAEQAKKPAPRVRIEEFLFGGDTSAPSSGRPRTIHGEEDTPAAVQRVRSTVRPRLRRSKKSGTF